MSASGAKGETRIEEPTAAERAIARRAAEARATVPDLELRADVDMAHALALRDSQAHSIPAILMRACALALRAVPRANGAYRDGRFELYSRVNIGIVVADEHSYLIPTVFDADQKSLAELTDEIERITGAARAGKLATARLRRGDVHPVRRRRARRPRARRSSSARRRPPRSPPARSARPPSSATARSTPAT